MRGLEILAQVILFGCCLTSRVYRCATPASFVSESKTIVNVFLKDVSFGAPLNLHSWNSFDLDSAWIKIHSNVIFSFSRTFSRLYRCGKTAFSASESDIMLNELLKYARFGTLLNLLKCLLCEKFNSLRLCVSQRFKPKSFYFLFLRLPACSDEPRSSF